VTLTVMAAYSCMTATPTNGWSNLNENGFSNTSEWFFDAMPTASPTSSLIGVSQGPQTSSAGFGTLVRFNSSGTIDALNGSTYEAVHTFKYKSHTTYHFTLDVNVPAHTYSVSVYAAGGNGGFGCPSCSTATTIATNYAFQTSQNTVPWMDNVGVEMDSTAAGDTEVCNWSENAPF
jgi:hypothetical protein